MCKKLFAVLLLLGLVSSALAVDYCDLLIHYTMDAEDSVYGYQYNYGRLGSIGDGKETFLAANNGDVDFNDLKMLADNWLAGIDY